MKTKLSLVLLTVLMAGSFCQSYAGKTPAPPTHNFLPSFVHPLHANNFTPVKPRTRGLVSKPGSQKNFTWMDTVGTYGIYDLWQNNNDGLGVLIHNSNEFFTYDSQGNVKEDLTTDTTGVSLSRYQYTYNWTTVTSALLQAWDGGQWIDSAESLYTYDSNGLLLKGIDLSWNGASWDSVDLYAQKYDPLGNPTVVYFMFWGTTSWDTIIGERDIYTYDANNHIVGDSLLVYQLGQWMNTEKLTYTVDGTGAWQSVTAQTWNTSTGWTNYARLYNATWYNFSAQEPYGYIQQGYSTGAWKDSLRIGASYDSYGGYVDTTLLKQNSSWVNYSLGSIIYDTHSNFIEELDQNWFQGSWILADQYNDDYTYDGSNTTRIVYRNWITNSDPGEEVNWTRTDFADFQEIDVSGVQNVNGNKQVSVYPNPSVNQINVFISDANFKVASVSIFNCLGENVELNSDINTSSSLITVPVNQLPAGIYFIRLTDNNQSCINAKFIKE